MEPEDAAGVHVLDALIDLPAAGPDLIEALGLQAVLLLRAARHRVERNVRDHHVAELPGVRPVGVVHQSRRLVQILLGQMVAEHVRRLDDVIVDADQDHVVFVHQWAFPFA